MFNAFDDGDDNGDDNRDVNHFFEHTIHNFLFVVAKSNHIPADITDDSAYLLITNKATYKYTQVAFSERSLKNFETSPMSTQD